MGQEELTIEVKKHLIEYLNLVDINPEDIKNDDPLFGGDLGLDSIDSLEIVVMLEREYGIKIQDPREGRKVFVDINTMVDYIGANRTAK